MAKLYEISRFPNGISNHEVESNLSDLPTLDNSKKNGVNLNFLNDISYIIPITQTDTRLGNNTLTRIHDEQIAQAPTNLSWYANESGTEHVAIPISDNGVVFDHILHPNQLGKSDVLGAPIVDTGMVMTNDTVETTVDQDNRQELSIATLGGRTKLKDRVVYQFIGKIITNDLPSLTLITGFYSEKFPLGGDDQFKIQFFTSTSPQVGGLNFNIRDSLPGGTIELPQANPDSKPTFTYNFGFSLSDHELILFVDDIAVKTLIIGRDVIFPDGATDLDLYPFITLKLIGFGLLPATGLAKANLFPKKLVVG